MLKDVSRQSIGDVNHFPLEMGSTLIDNRLSYPHHEIGLVFQHWATEIMRPTHGVMECHILVLILSINLVDETTSSYSSRTNLLRKLIDSLDEFISTGHDITTEEDDKEWGQWRIVLSRRHRPLHLENYHADRHPYPIGYLHRRN
jgi:hypothetical protein